MRAAEQANAGTVDHFFSRVRQIKDQKRDALQHVHPDFSGGQKQESPSKSNFFQESPAALMFYKIL